MNHGEIINIKYLGERKIRKARKPGPCAGWAKRGDGHQIEKGDLYVETELKHGGSPFAMHRCCLNCLEE